MSFRGCDGITRELAGLEQRESLGRRPLLSVRRVEINPELPGHLFECKPAEAAMRCDGEDGAAGTRVPSGYYFCSGVGVGSVLGADSV
jgi:hypothetical protein